MTGFLRSVLIRGIGASAAGQAQFATVPARSLFVPRETAALPDAAYPGMAVTPSPDHGQPPQMTVKRSAKLPPEEQPLPTTASAKPTSTPAREDLDRTRAREPLPGVEPSRQQEAPAIMHAAAQAVGPDVLKVRPDMNLDRGVTDARGTGDRQSAVDLARVPQERDPEAMDPGGQRRAIRPEQQARGHERAAIATRTDSGTTIEIGRIDIVITPSPAAPVDRGPDRTNGFATHEQRRLGPRR
ncbi:hypothetical protein [Rhizobium grahamii]|uniref:Uncharacterized protein n=1 Tax=Rhizobium grahamii TaxID=1120045 RepID=A0A370KGQ5_9HYPH|nr:hypothetical protein [Rhizobium grahamii]RDJ03963.1 hypothetical protein B5K06_29105 [Rhizobium grahamii]